VRHPASFRDPESGVLLDGDRILRSFSGTAIADAREAIASGLFQRLLDDGRILAFEVVDDPVKGAEGSFTLEQPRLPFVSYPYEWSFSMLKAAALLTLDVLSAALESGFTLSDGTAYNVQFIATKPVFIDLGSFRKHSDGDPWNGYAQFCRHFLFPLLLTTYSGVHHQRLLRSALDGVPPRTARALLPFRAKARPSVFAHVVLQAALSDREIGADDELKRAARVPRAAVLKTVGGLRRLIESLHRPRERSEWSDYERERSYTSEAHRVKLDVVRAAVAQARPRSIWDMGCNVGTYTMPISADAPVVVGMDSDPVSVDLLYRAASKASANVLPLVMDVADPSPTQGWAQRERQGLAERAPTDLALCLALIHHVRFTAGIPVPEFVRWLASVARSAVIEFVPRSDPMVRRMLAWRSEGSCPDYEPATFERALTESFEVAERREVPDSGRILYTLRPRWNAA
jgi:hypothetical protein